MKFECVIICVNFADILAHTLPLNKHHFDRMVVVTDRKDEATRRLCDHHYVECLFTDEFYRDDQAFNKGRGINVGLAALDAQEWVVHMDADIVLPSRARMFWENICGLDPTCLYGADRLMCEDFESWNNYQGDPTIQHAEEIFVIPDAFRLGVRVARLNGDGYLPIGYFQMWNPKVSGITKYPDQHGTAGRADMLHAMKWDRKNRVLIPEIFCIHLDSPKPPGMVNWRGRVSDHFGPGEHHHRHHHHHHGSPKPCPPYESGTP